MPSQAMTANTLADVSTISWRRACRLALLPCLSFTLVCGIPQPHPVGSSLTTTPDRCPLLGERGGALAGILGLEDRLVQFRLPSPAFRHRPVGLLTGDLLGDRDGQRPVGGDHLAQP